jgi:ADP-ribose pyrophosphatase YjhB (NUDIX family)
MNLQQLKINKEIHVLARAVIIDQGMILLSRAKQFTPEFFVLPGGHIEHGESARQALQRELLEESGFEFQVKRFVGCLECSFDMQNICHSHEYNLIFEAESFTVRAMHSLPSAIKLEWLSFEKLPEINLQPKSLKDCLKEWLKSDLNLSFQSQMLC